MSVRVPLVLRPANPPLPFVGRASEEKRLVDVIARGPIAVVCGFSGVGKSALVAHALATRFADARAHTLVVEGGGDVVENALVTLAKLGAHAEPSAIDPAHALLELLEEHGLWLSLDDVERVDDGLRAFLTLAQRFASRARVICVCREDPRDPALAPHTIAVGPMSPADLRALLDDVEPDLSDSEAAGIVALAKGSPWRLRQLSMGGAVDEQGPEKSLLMLAPIAMGLLRTLALVAGSVPADVLARATRMPAADAVETLARRGYVEISARGLRLHPSARPLVDAMLDADDRVARAHKLVRAVVEIGSADVAASVLPLLSSCPADLVRAFVDKHGAALRHDGHARALLDVVDDARALTLALDVGGDALIRWHATELADAASNVLLARVLAARGDLDAACAIAAPIAADQSAPHSARVHAVDVLLFARDDAADRKQLARIAKEKLAATERAWCAALALPHAGDPHDVARAVEALPADEQRELAPIAARALRLAGDPRAAERVVALASPSLQTIHGRAAALERAHTALALADLDDARDRFLRALSFPNALERVEARLGALATRLAVGDLRGFHDDVAAAIAALQEHEAPPHLARAADALLDALRSLGGGGEPGRALPSLDEARKARARARDAGRALDALEAGAVCVDAALVGADVASVAVEAELLASAAARAGSRRYALDARFAALVVDKGSDGKLSSTGLVELARLKDENPRVARRAAAMLGENVPLDDVDRAVLAAMSAHAARPAVAHVVKQTTEGPEWTVDASTMRIILVDGSVVDLSTRKVLFDLLATLCEKGGAATKEELLERAWGVREYHPLHHDNRLKVAVRKLRRLLEEILGADPIETADDGYRLRGKVRFLKG